ncbi:MAG: hypothetical protein ABH834_06960, partial [Candidatus Altiarchaeota archaeon]
YDGALTHYRASKRRVSGRVDVDAFMQASAAETAGLHGIAFDYSALWEPVGVSDVDSELLALAVTELSTNACKNAKKVSDGEPSAGVTWAIMSAGSIPANVKAFFDGASVNAEKFIMLVFTNNGELMSDEMIQALNRGDTSVLSESTSDSAGTGLRDLIENILPELPAAIFFERNDHHHTQDVQLFIPRSAKAASAGASSGAAARISKRRMAYVGGGVEALDEPAEERFATGKPRVIIVDDFRDFAEILEERIQGDMGDAVETVVCTSTAEFDAAAATAFDAVVSDYVLEAPHLKEAVEAERAGKSRTGRYVCRRAREINPNTLTILYSIDNVIDPDSPEGADASLHEHAPADPCFVNWGLNKGTHEITRSDGASFTRVTAESIGMPEGTPWFFVASRLVEEDLKTKQKI